MFLFAPSEPSGGVKINILFVLPVFAAFGRNMVQRV